MSRRKSLGRFCSVVALCLMLAGCNAVKQTVEVPVYVHDTTYVAKEVHDSTFIDRWHTEYQKGDTIFITNEVTKIVTKIKTDTAYKYIEKPVVVSNTETVEVEKPLSWWQKTFVWIGVLCLIGIVLWLVWKFRKLIFKT
jgi:hypothetical protein